MIALADRLEIDAGSVRETRDGYLVANALTARTGIQTYTARELQLDGMDPRKVLNVYRPPSAVFDAKALASMGWRPMTNDHPPENVTAENWKKLSIGNAGGDVVRDGNGVRVPLVMMDATAIADYRAGKRQLSWGYTCEITMRDGVVPEGEPDAGKHYDAVQSDIQANHIALCYQARGGDKLTFGDHQPGEKPVKTILVDGLMVEVTDAAEAAIVKLQGQLKAADAATTTAQTRAGELAAELVTVTSAKDGEIAALNQKLADAVVTPEKLQAMAADRANLERAAKPLVGDAFDFKGKADADIRRAAVVARMGDSAKDMDDAAVSGAFRVLAADGLASGSDPVRDALNNGGGFNVTDGARRAEDARAAMIANLKGEPDKKAA